MPWPRPRHARAATRLIGRLQPFDEDPGEPGGWVLLLEPEIHLGPKPDKIVPDVTGWRRERLPKAVFDDDSPGQLVIAPAPLATDFPARMLIDWAWYKPL
jgi:hypothetical protein